jgi:hypothetical protein
MDESKSSSRWLLAFFYGQIKLGNGDSFSFRKSSFDLVGGLKKPEISFANGNINKRLFVQNEKCCRFTRAPGKARIPLPFYNASTRFYR